MSDLDSVVEDSEAVALSKKGNRLLEQFNTSGDTSELHESIHLFRKALMLHPKAYDQRMHALQDLTGALTLLFELNGNLNLLVETAALEREVLQLQPPGHSDRVDCLTNLLVSLREYFSRTGQLGSLKEMAVLGREIVQLRPARDPERPFALASLASTLRLYAQQTGQTEALMEAIEINREAIRLLPENHPERYQLSINLANQLFALYKTAANVRALDECLRLNREVISVASLEPEARCVVSFSLSNTLIAYFEHNGDLSMLAEAIRFGREALSARPPGHPARFRPIFILAGALWKFCEQTGDNSSLLESIDLYCECISLTTPEYPEHPIILSNYASVLWKRYESTGDRWPLEESIRLGREALKLLPPDHRYRLLPTVSLTNSLRDMADETVELNDVTEAIKLNLEALELCTGHPQRQLILRNLGSCYSLSFRIKGEGGDLKSAVKYVEQAIEESMEGHPERHKTYILLSYLLLQDPGSSIFDVSKALEIYSLAIHDHLAASRSRVKTAVPYFNSLESRADLHLTDLQSKIVLDLYTATVQLLPRVAHLGLDTPVRLRELIGTEDMCRAAAIRAALLTEPDFAVELFEEGQGLFWQQALRLRSNTFDGVPVDKQEKLVSLFRELENDRPPASKMEMEDQLEQRRKMSEELSRIIDEVRARPGMERFLKTPSSDQLYEATKYGFVVLLVEGPHCSIALILSKKFQDRVLTVHLPLVTPKALQSLLQRTGTFNKMTRAAVVEDEQAESLRGPMISNINSGPVSALADLWRLVVKPVIDALELSKSRGRDRPRMFWRSSGRFACLPVHAAGIYKFKHQACLSDYAVSSYIPSIPALLSARAGSFSLSRDNVKMLIVGESSAPGLPILENVKEEVSNIIKIAESTSVSILGAPSFIPSAHSVIRDLPEAHLLHLSCHGEQHDDPLESYFALRNGP